MGHHDGWFQILAGLFTQVGDAEKPFVSTNCYDSVGCGGLKGVRKFSSDDEPFTAAAALGWRYIKSSKVTFNVTHSFLIRPQFLPSSETDPIVVEVRKVL